MLTTAPLSSPQYLKLPRRNKLSYRTHWWSAVCVMRCRTTVGKSLLNLRPQLWPYGKHWSSCTIILSKQTAEGRSFWQKGHWVNPTTLYPITSFPGMVRSSKRMQPQANDSHRWIAIKSYCCKNSSGPPTGHLKARAVSPCWDTVCCWGLFTLIWDERLPTTTRGIGRGRKYSGLTGFGGIKKTVASGGQRLGSGSDVKSD